MQYFFFSRKLCFLCSPCLLLVAESVGLNTSGKPTMGFFSKITSSSWIILSVALDELNSIDWLWILMLNFLAIILISLCKRILIWRKMFEVFLRIYLNIIFWILLWMVTSSVIWNLNTTVSTTLKYCYQKASNKKLKLVGGTMI